MCRHLFIVILIALATAAADQDKVAYTEDLQKFKTDKHKIRLEMLVGCWLMTREYMPMGNQLQKLALIKICMKHITRKDSVVKITSLIGKNMTSTKSYQQIVPFSEIPQLGAFSESASPQFDSYLLGMLKNYERDLLRVQGEEGKQLKKKVEQQVQKRTKYYFGIIPANQWTHLMMLIGTSLLLVMLCTCWKYFQLRKSKKQQQRAHKHDQNCKHSKVTLKDLKGSPKKTK